MTIPNTLADIRQKVRRITGRPSDNQITDDQIDQYINTYYIYDLPEQLQLISNRVNYQFMTNANQAVYDLPNNMYLTGMPPVFIGGYQSYMTQSRDRFYRINPSLNYLQDFVATGTNSPGPYTGTLGQTPIMRGWKRNPPGAYSTSVSGTQSDQTAGQLSWNVSISGPGNPNGTSGITPSFTLVDDGQGNLFDPVLDLSTDPAFSRGSINYITGAISITNFGGSIANGAPINAQYVPYVASRPQSVVFYQQQFNLYPIPDQAYTVSFEAYVLPTALLDPDGLGTYTPQMLEWWQVLAYGAADKIFTDNNDIENVQKFRPFLDEQLKLIQRRTIVQQTSERTSSIYEEQCPLGQYPFGNNFSGF